jgi:hypothetical protein
MIQHQQRQYSSLSDVSIGSQPGFFEREIMLEMAL